MYKACCAVYSHQKIVIEFDSNPIEREDVSCCFCCVQLQNFWDSQTKHSQISTNETQTQVIFLYRFCMSACHQTFGLKPFKVFNLPFSQQLFETKPLQTKHFICYFCSAKLSVQSRNLSKVFYREIAVESVVKEKLCVGTYRKQNELLGCEFTCISLMKPLVLPKKKYRFSKNIYKKTFADWYAYKLTSVCWKLLSKNFNHKKKSFWWRFLFLW